MSLEALIEEALKYDIKALALTDINNSMGMTDFVKLCKANNIKPIAGVELRNGNIHLYTGIARNKEGFRELNEFVTVINESHAEYPDRAPDLDHVIFIYPFRKLKYDQLKENEFIGIRPSDLPLLLTSDLRHQQVRLLIYKPVTIRNQQDHFIHLNLRAIDRNVVFSRLTVEDVSSPDEFFVSADQLHEIYSSYPQIISNTERITEDCSIDFDFEKVKNKKTFTRHHDIIVIPGTLHQIFKMNRIVRLTYRSNIPPLNCGNNF